MAASFVQESFLGGQWSPLAQGRMSEPSYKEGMNECLNGFPLESGPWTRRPGFRFLGVTRGGKTGRIIPFNWSITKPYQIEMTDQVTRIYNGDKLVTVGLGAGETSTIVSISTATPAVVTFENALPANWNNGDTIIFEQMNYPRSSPYLCNRQFLLQNKNAGAKTFTLKDPVTLADIDGSKVAYVAGAIKDKAHKVREMASTLYTEAKLNGIYTVSSIDEDNKDNVLLLHPTVKPHFIYSYGQGSVNPFDIAVRDFEDGPYMDQQKLIFPVTDDSANPNTNTTRLALNARSGSVTITAHQVKNINPTPGVDSGTGFKSTDVLRHIRIFFTYPVFADAFEYSYAVGDKVYYGGNGKTYEALQANSYLDPKVPATNPTYWKEIPDDGKWFWIRITAFTNSTTVTGTIQATEGIDAVFGLRSWRWRLGLYSDTTGWPSCGEYHEGRLWLSGPQGNRIDASVPNKYINFSPTAQDGTVADSNALALISNATEISKFLWMQSTKEGLLAGTQAGEWRVRSSVQDNPITPFSVQIRRVSRFGCAPVQPITASNQTIFLQKQTRKVLGYIEAQDNIFYTENLSITADHLTKDGIKEITWQQEPNLNIWARRADGILLGCTYKKANGSPSQKTLEPIWTEPSAGWHIHAHGGGRIFESIAASPSFDGISDTLYAITKDPASAVRFIEALLPVFDAQQADWANSFVDCNIAADCVQEKRTAAGDSFNGLRIWGLHHLAGKTVVPVIGGLDCGDRVVSADGYVDVAYSSDPAGKFTEAFLFAFDDGTDYGLFTSNVSTNSNGVVTFPCCVGFNYTSRGQLLRPDYGIDAGARNGPAFAKKRRLHQFAIDLYRTQGLRIGTNFATMYPIKLQTEGGTPVAVPVLYSGTAEDTVQSDYNFQGQLAWECNRPYPATIVAIGGFIQLQDK